LINKTFREKDNGQVIDWDGSKNRVNLSKSASMIEFISLDSCELSPEFINNEGIRLMDLANLQPAVKLLNIQPTVFPYIITPPFQAIFQAHGHITRPTFPASVPRLIARPTF
jgi:hypothetical protein